MPERQVMTVNPARRPRFRYDSFISYSHRSKDWVRSWLVPQLRNSGLKTCIDFGSFEPGAPSLTEMERAVLQSRKTVLVLTPEYLRSGWTEFENILVQTLDPAAHQRRLIPVLLLHCELPLLGDFSLEEIWELNRRYELPLKRKGQMELLVDVIGGHPYLAQQALYALASREHTLPRILDLDNADVGPFADHLHRHRHLLESEPALGLGMRQAITTGRCPTYEIFSYLRSIGLITGMSQTHVKPRCRLYIEYFQRVLS